MLGISRCPGVRRILTFGAWAAILSTWSVDSGSRLLRLAADYQDRADNAQVEEYFATVALEQSLVRRDELHATVASTIHVDGDGDCVFRALAFSTELVIIQQAERASRWRQLRQKYARAASRPWETVAPDPPEPTPIRPPVADDRATHLLAKTP